MTPLHVAISRRDSPVELTVARDVYAPLVETVTLDADQRLRLSLERARSPHRPRRGSEAESPPERDLPASERPAAETGFFRFD